jgi:hypothetical protein
MTHYWFRPKRYGYGATPVNWQGWTATFGIVAVLVGSVLVLNRLVDRPNLSGWLIWGSVIAAITLGFVELSLRKTDGEWRWRWGARDNKS